MGYDTYHFGFATVSPPVKNTIEDYGLTFTENGSKIKWKFIQKTHSIPIERIVRYAKQAGSVVNGLFTSSDMYLTTVTHIVDNKIQVLFIKTKTNIQYPIIGKRVPWNYRIRECKCSAHNCDCEWKLVRSSRWVSDKLLSKSREYTLDSIQETVDSLHYRVLFRGEPLFSVESDELFAEVIHHSYIENSTDDSE